MGQFPIKLNRLFYFSNEFQETIAILRKKIDCELLYSTELTNSFLFFSLFSSLFFPLTTDPYYNREISNII